MGARGVGVFILFLISAAFILTSYEVTGANSNLDHDDHGRKLISASGLFDDASGLVGKGASHLIPAAGKEFGKVAKVWKATKPYRRGMKLACKLGSMYCCYSNGEDDSSSCGMLCCLDNLSDTIITYINNPCDISPSQYESCCALGYNQCQNKLCYKC